MKMKNIIRIALSVLTAGSMFLSALPAQAAAGHPNLLIGDADRDGMIDIDDVTAIQRRLAEMITFDEQTETMAKTDFTRDDLTIADATVIQKHLAAYDTPEAREVGHAAYIYKNKKYIKAVSNYEKYLKSRMDEYEFNGVGLVTRNGHVLAQYARTKNSYEDYDYPYDVTDNQVTMDTQFAIGSVSKQICATAVLMLQDQGKLSVTDKLEQYFPEYSIGKELTLHQLLCMRSGIRCFINYDSSPVYQDEPYPDWYGKLNGNREHDVQTVKQWIFSQPLRYTSTNVSSYSYSYSNSNFLLLALVVEQVSGMSYYDFVKENIFTPLGMTHSCFVHEAKACPGLEKYRFECRHGAPEYGCLLGGGDVASTADDMDKWLTALSDNKLLSAESYRAMTTSYSQTQQYGYGIIIDNKNPDTTGGLYHNGWVLDYRTGVFTLPSEHLNIFLVTNDSTGLYESDQDPATIVSQIANTIVKTEKNK